MTRWIDRVNREPHQRPSHDTAISRRVVHPVSTQRSAPEPVQTKTGPTIVELPVVQPPAEPTHSKPPTIVDSPPVQAVENIEEQQSIIQPNNHRRNRLPKLRRKPQLKWTVPVAMLIVVGLGVYGVVNWSREPVKSNVLAAQTVEEAAAITTNEKPVILYVTDNTKVAQPFLDKAENGDEVRLYYQAKKAVLYRPSTYSVISVGDFTPPPANVFIRNGTNGSVQISKIEAQIKKLPQYTVVSKDKSSSSTYQETMVIDISGRYPEDAKKLATDIGATLGSMPKSESTPEADILVIVGSQ